MTNSEAIQIINEQKCKLLEELFNFDEHDEQVNIDEVTEAYDMAMDALKNRSN